MSEQSFGKILIVDDEVELKNALVDSLTAQSFVVRGFTDPQEALAVLEHEEFDVLLSDLMMPQMDGIALVTAALEIDPYLVPIIMTGQGTIQTAVDAMKAGTFDYVLKPFRMRSVMPVLTRALNTRRLHLENLQLKETVAIYELSQTIAFTLDSQAIISKLADAALQQSDADEVSILLPTPEANEMVVAAVRGEDRQLLLGERVPLEQTIAGWVARERQPLLLEGQVNDDRFRVMWPHPEIRSSISIPMLVANKLVGTIHLNSVKRARPFRLGQMKALTILASTAAAALESASLYAKVRMTEGEYRSIFENAVEGIFRSVDERYTRVNPAMARMFGYDSPEQMVAEVKDMGRDIYVNPKERQRSIELEDQEGFLKGFVFEAHRRNGEKIWVSLNRRSIFDDDGVLLYREGTLEDITERKRAEDAVHSSQQLLEGIINSLPVGVFWKDKNLVYLGCNATFARDAGLADPKEVIGKNDHQLGNKRADFYRRDDRKVIETGRTRLLQEEPSTSPDGAEITILTSKIPLRDSNGDVAGVIGTYIDITELKRAEEALRQSEERYRDLVENAHDIIYSHDLQGNYTSINKAGEVVSGYTVEEALKLNLKQTTAPEYLPRAVEMMQRKLAGERVTAYEIEILAKDGHRVSVEVNTKLVYENGVPVGVQGIARDITERKLLEEQLRQSQKMEAIGQLAGGVAHDFNNLLTAINGYSSLALQRIDDNSSIKPYLEEVRKAGDRAANLTRQLLAFGRKQILQPVPLDLNNIVTDMNKMLRRLIGEDVELTAKLSSDLKKIKADPGQIEQVIVNLAVNARDAMPQGGNLTIETANVTLSDTYAALHVGSHAGNYVMLAVSDTGTGMDEATRARIFEPFFTTKEKGKGTGLGLSTVYGIVQQSGGSIWVYSELNRGTTFKVYLPQLPSEAGLAEEKESKADQIVSGSETILLVEDEDVVRGLATNILETAGYNVLSSAGQDAVEVCERAKGRIHLLLTDVVMPQTSGKEIADKLKKLKPRLKVLYMSGYTDEAIVHHGVLDENVEFIQKPFTPAALSRKVREVLDSNGRTRKN